MSVVVGMPLPASGRPVGVRLPARATSGNARLKSSVKVVMDACLYMYAPPDVNKRKKY
jgi:hypothetical protein